MRTRNEIKNKLKLKLKTKNYSKIQLKYARCVTGTWYKVFVFQLVIVAADPDLTTTYWCILPLCRGVLSWNEASIRCRWLSPRIITLLRASCSMTAGEKQLGCQWINTCFFWLWCTSGTFKWGGGGMVCFFEPSSFHSVVGFNRLWLPSAPGFLTSTLLFQHLETPFVPTFGSMHVLYCNITGRIHLPAVHHRFPGFCNSLPARYIIRVRREIVVRHSEQHLPEYAELIPVGTLLPLSGSRLK